MPTGNTEFQFQAGNLNFNATSLRLAGRRRGQGQYRGRGTINGAGGYGFTSTA